MCRRQTLTPLSPAERSVAEQHYRLVEWYVRHRGLPVDEYLDVAVFGYLLAVKRSHKRLNGERVPIDAKFSNGLMRPCDPDCTDPAEVVNCHCFLTFDK